MQKQTKKDITGQASFSDEESFDGSSDSYVSTSSEDEAIEEPVRENSIDKLDRNKKLQLLEDTGDLSKIIHLTKDADPRVKIKAVQTLCPCKIKRDFEAVYDRLFELSTDEDPKIRYQVLHNICDGSPQDYEARVMKALDNFNRDKDKKIRRAAHKVMASVLKNGNWNVL